MSGIENHLAVVPEGFEDKLAAYRRAELIRKFGPDILVEVDTLIEDTEVTGAAVEESQLGISGLKSAVGGDQ